MVWYAESELCLWVSEVNIPLFKAEAILCCMRESLLLALSPKALPQLRSLEQHCPQSSAVLPVPTILADGLLLLLQELKLVWHCSKQL